MVVRDSVRARADQGHLPLQHVEQLRQLIQRGAADEPPDGGNPRVIAAGLDHLAIIVHAHRAEFPHLNHLAVPAVAILLKNTGPGELIFTASAMNSSTGLNRMIASSATPFPPDFCSTQQ